ncbi:MraY family glycosyltransferase [Polaribacter sp. Hel1_85]|uniref:MraY family glycosyltransferase n=1 Tax=Polaribacter sp. Hel1_85 TaxID=1250005 RepID=UPI00052CA11F|nr:glycosyltransferase family 4 protein [Polaribacter sp. Hel1_85]KGL64347.1 UDP-N-acetylmuramyl pentapeptide phosphotransferase/UDP-N-acetylglucosamine-1-phosphate transferase [Polaribacter sp. Hel1_85]
MEKYFLVLIILILASYLYLKLAVKFKIIDKPNQRSSHTKITVRGGGIIFPIAILLFFFFNDYQYPYFVLGVFLISIVSFLDDIYTLSSKIRFPFQLLSVVMVLYQVGVPIEALSLFYLILGVGTINFFNFMDGINGITGLYSIAVLSIFYFINLNEEIINPDLIIYPFISLIVFGFYNFRKKAVFFAGDIGSVTIGILIFFILLYFYVELKSPLIILAIIVYGADAANTFLYRKIFTNESVFEPHRHHVYQKLVDIKKMSHIKVSLIYTIIQLLLNVVLYKTYQLELQTQFLILISIISFFILIYILVFKKLKVRN